MTGAPTLFAIAVAGIAIVTLVGLVALYPVWNLDRDMTGEGREGLP